MLNSRHLPVSTGELPPSGVPAERPARLLAGDEQAFHPAAVAVPGAEQAADPGLHVHLGGLAVKVIFAAGQAHVTGQGRYFRLQVIDACRPRANIGGRGDQNISLRVDPRHFHAAISAFGEQADQHIGVDAILSAHRHGVAARHRQFLGFPVFQAVTRSHDIGRRDQLEIGTGDDGDHLVDVINGTVAIDVLVGEKICTLPSAASRKFSVPPAGISR